MAVSTTGSTLIGLSQGLATQLPASANAANVKGLGRVIVVNGGPDAVVTGVPQSGISYDATNGELYMNKTTGGSTWIHLGSIS